MKPFRNPEWAKKYELVKAKISLDKEDMLLLEEHRFWESGDGYPSTKINGKIVKLHHLLLSKKEGLVIDHINRNKWDNRRSNLRYVTKRENILNCKKLKNNTSGFRGVSRHNNSWQARIVVHGKVIILGEYKEKTDAAKAYQEAAKLHFGEFIGVL